jgi:hypothetical protein
MKLSSISQNLWTSPRYRYKAGAMPNGHAGDIAADLHAATRDNDPVEHEPALGRAGYDQVVRGVGLPVEQPDDRPLAVRGPQLQCLPSASSTATGST